MLMAHEGCNIMISDVEGRLLKCLMAYESSVSDQVNFPRQDFYRLV